MFVARGYVSQEQIAAEIERARQKLGPEVVRLTHSVGPDHDDEPAIHIRIVLTDAASVESTLADVTGKITATLFDEVRPYESGMRMYFSFRSQSEQANRNDLAWA